MSITLSVNKMKTLLGLLLLIPSLSFGKMISLEDYERQNPNMGVEEAIYIPYRCSAIFYHLSKLNQKEPDVYESSIAAFEYFTQVAMVMMGKISPDADVNFNKNWVSNNIKIFFDEYTEISNEYYLKTGIYLNNDMYKDIDFCTKSLPTEY